MGLETGEFIEDLNTANPAGIDPLSDGDAHLRLIKTVLQGSFPNTSGANNIGAPLQVEDAVLEDQATTLSQVNALIAAALSNLQIQVGRIAQDGTELWDSEGQTQITKTDTGEYTMTFTEAATAVESQAIFLMPLFNNRNGIGMGYDEINAQQIIVYGERYDTVTDAFIPHDIGFAYLRVWV